MSRVSITREALCELRERIAQSKWQLGVSIVGPLDYDVRAPENPEEAWAVQKLYGPPQRWVLNLLPVTVLGDSADAGFVDEVDGILIRIMSPIAVPSLRVELQGDAIRVYEVDA